MSSPSLTTRPVVLCVLDGWGISSSVENNAVALAHKPVFDHLVATCPNGVLEASEGFVGLPVGQMGNSEVGHITLGSGRVVIGDLTRIDQAFADGSLAINSSLQYFCSRLNERGGTAHVMGLISPGGVHSHQEQIAKLVRLLNEAGIPVVVHAFLDGRDTPPVSALAFIAKFQEDVGSIPVVTITGRFYAMDRDKRWERTKAAYTAIAHGEGERAADVASAVAAAVLRGESDEFVFPTVIGYYNGMCDGDGVVMANFRADRVRQILDALLDYDFQAFDRGKQVEFAASLGLVQYSEKLDQLMPAIFPTTEINDTLGAFFADLGLKQLRIAETEKYAHVTFFFNGGEETIYPGEERILIPSPKVKTYDLQPEMSSYQVVEKLVDAINKERFDFIVVNFSNTDMVGHTGVLSAAIHAVEAVDVCLGKLMEAVGRVNGTLFITADHGNAETMIDPLTRKPHTSHTLNRVPAILYGGPPDVTGLTTGSLADVAPTLIDLMGLAKPAAMTGRSLLRRAYIP